MQRLDVKSILDAVKAKPLQTLGAVAALGAVALVILVSTGIASSLANRVLGKLDNESAPDLNRIEVRWTPLETALHDVDMLRIPVGNWTDFGGGGAIEQVGDLILIMTPKGEFRYIGSNNEFRALGASVDMNNAGFIESGWLEDPLIRDYWFRTHDLFIRNLSEDRYEVFASHHRFADDCVEIVLSRAELSLTNDALSAGPSGFEPIYIVSPCVSRKDGGFPFSGHQSGGRIQEYSETELLMTTGDFELDGHNSPIRASADDSMGLGKVHLINTDTGEGAIVAKGLRNPAGLIIAENGRIWITDSGPQGGDELNELTFGSDYGWPEVTYGFNYGYPRRPWPLNPSQGRHDGSIDYAKPTFVFMPSIAVTNLVEVTKPEFGYWQSDLLVGSLAAQTLFRLRLEEDRVIYNEAIEINERIRDIIQLDDGRIAMLTDTPHLIILRNAEKAAEKTADVEDSTTFVGLRSVQEAQNKFQPTFADAKERGRALFQANCASCHEAAKRENHAGPHLVGIVGREVGSVEGFAYSERLSSDTSVWTEDRLVSFLMNPSEEFEGTYMGQVGELVPHAEWPSVVAYLEDPG
ncbi:MAG: PQQ-dependent sugar dehydrogenase [Pseudomonadota bacterium]